MGSLTRKILKNRPGSITRSTVLEKIKLLNLLSDLYELCTENCLLRTSFPYWIQIWRLSVSVPFSSQTLIKQILPDWRRTVWLPSVSGTKSEMVKRLETWTAPTITLESSIIVVQLPSLVHQLAEKPAKTFHDFAVMVCFSNNISPPLIYHHP